MEPEHSDGHTLVRYTVVTVTYITLLIYCTFDAATIMKDLRRVLLDMIGSQLLCHLTNEGTSFISASEHPE